jgi:putative membrane protein
MLYVKSGLLRRRLWLISVDKVQSITMLRSPLQRTLGLATLVIDTAGASSMRSASIVDLDTARASRLAAELLADFQEKRRVGRELRNVSPAARLAT